jgi:shikimate dehydrogenase
MKAAVLGSPIAHSLSPVLHRAAYRALGLADWCYAAIECDEVRLPGLLDECGPGWAGLSLTMPLKRAVLGLLDHVEPLALEVGAANTVVFANGARSGHNTDVPGMISAVTEAGLPGAEAGPPPAPALILGAGATACSALAAVRGFGMREATVAARDTSRASGLLAAADRLGMTVRLTAFDAPGEAAPGWLISTVPAGAADLHAQRIRSGSLAPRYVLDVVYHPWPTPLAVAAKQAGAVVAGGFDLLLHQAAGQVSLMTGLKPPVEAMRAAGLSTLVA